MAAVNGEGSLTKDATGIYFSSGKNNLFTRTSLERGAELDSIIGERGGKKICVVVDISTSKPISKSEREEVAKQLELTVSAMAVLIQGPLSRMMANLFLGLSSPSYPVRIFTSRTEAVKWITQYL